MFGQACNFAFFMNYPEPKEGYMADIHISLEGYMSALCQPNISRGIYVSQGIYVFFIENKIAGFKITWTQKNSLKFVMTNKNDNIKFSQTNFWKT